MPRKPSVVVCLALTWAHACLASAETAREGLPGLRGTAQEAAQVGSPPTEQPSLQATRVGKGRSVLTLLAASGSRDLQADFEAADDNGDGFLSPAEFHAMCQADFAKIGMQATGTTFTDTMFQLADTNGDGKISFEEFVTYEKPGDPREIEEACQTFDINGNKSISKDELQFFFGILDIWVTDASKFDAWFSSADTDGDGELSCAEFAKVPGA